MGRDKARQQPPPVEQPGKCKRRPEQDHAVEAKETKLSMAKRNEGELRDLANRPIKSGSLETVGRVGHGTNHHKAERRIPIQILELAPYGKVKVRGHGQYRKDH